MSDSQTPSAANASTSHKSTTQRYVDPLAELRHTVETQAKAATPAIVPATVSTSRLAYVGNAPKANEKFVRKTREQLNTGNARQERRERLPMTYDALETDAPVRAQDDYITAEFKHDEFVKGRQVRARYINNDKDRETFDAENFDLLPATSRNTVYLDKLQTRRLGLDAGVDPVLEAELEAARVVPTTEEWAMWKRDVHNPEFARNIKKNAVTSTTKLSEVDRERRLNDAKAEKERRESIHAAFEKHRLTTKENPDFYTGYSDFDLAKKRDKIKQAKALKELQKKKDDNKDDDGDDTTKKDNNDDDEVEDPNEVAEEDAPVQISNEDARQLLAYNPLARLQQLLHRDFLALPEIMMTWNLLFPLQMMSENRRRHYNPIEFVRAMNLCGAKYDGCVLLTAPSRLGNLVAKEFYAPCIDQGRFVGKHEHYDEKRTVLVVFKFYLVERSKSNVNALSKYALDEDNTANLMNTDAYDPNRIASDHAQTRLNTAALYDQDNIEDVVDDAEARSIYGSMHNIKRLAEAFMFCLRVVCAVPETDYHSDASDGEGNVTNNGFISEEDNDFVLPEDVNAGSRRGERDAALTSNDANIGRDGEEKGDEEITIGPDDLREVGGAELSPRGTLASLRRLDNLQESVFDDDDNDDNDNGSQPREIIVSEGTHNTTTTSQRSGGVAGRSSTTSGSRLLSGARQDAGSNSIDEDDDDDVEDLDFRARTSRIAAKQQRTVEPVHHHEDLDAYRNKERYGVRFVEDDDEEDRFEEDVQDDDVAASKPALVASKGAPPVDKYEIHTDDENAQAALEDSEDSSANDYRPNREISLTLEEAKLLVGEWKAADFMKKVNKHYLTKLCVRAFAYYGVSLPITTKQVGKKNKKNKK